MKKKYPVLAFVALTALAWSGCSHDAEHAIDCIGESILMEVHHSADAQNAHIINFTFSYSGEKTLDNSIHWDFGDGQAQNITGTTASHTYAGAGSYTVKTTPTLHTGKSSCSATITKHVTIN